MQQPCQHAARVISARFRVERPTAGAIQSWATSTSLCHIPLVVGDTPQPTRTPESLNPPAFVRLLAAILHLDMLAGTRATPFRYPECGLPAANRDDVRHACKWSGMDNAICDDIKAYIGFSEADDANLRS